jgi:hypothetical protein
MTESNIDYKRLSEKITKLKAKFNSAPLKKDSSQNEPVAKNVRRLVEIKKIHQIQIENLSPEQDKFFVKELLVPYLSNVYFGLIKRQNRDYLGIKKTKQYLSLPELIGDRLVK